MPQVTTVGNILLEQALPESAKGHYDTLDSKGLKKLLTYIAKEHPEDMSKTLRALTDVSRDTIYFRGRDASLGLDDLRMPPELQKYRDSIRQEVAGIMEGFGSAKEKQKQIIDLLMKRIKEIPDTLLEKLPENNALSMQVKSGARGNKSQLMQTLFGDTLVVDAQDKPVPIPALHGYGEGVTPMEYWAASNGARKGSVSVQFSTAEGGYFGKQMSNIGHRVVVTSKDCGTHRGIPVDADDEDNVGSVLAQDVGPYKAGTIITQDMMGKLGDGKIMVRSLVTCEQGDGVCSVCCGVREKNRLPDIGDPVGIVATRSISEPVTQAGLKCLDPETEIRMADWSIKKLKDIKVGDMVMGADRKGNLSPAKVLNVWDNGTQPMYKYTWTVGPSNSNTTDVISTETHKGLYVHECEKYTNDGVSNDVPSIEPPYSGKDVYTVYPRSCNPITEGVHEDNAWILGVMTGDGCYTESVHTPHISCDDPTLVPAIEEALEKMDMKLHFHKGSQCYWRVSNIVEYNGDHTPNRMIDLLKKYNMYEKYSFEKEFPVGWEKWDRESALNYLSGIIDTDGHIGVHNNIAMMSFGQTNLKMVEQIRECVAKFFGSPYITITHSGSDRRKHILWQVRFTNPGILYRILKGLTLHGQKATDKERVLRYLEDARGKKNLEDGCYMTGRLVCREYLGERPAMDIEVDNEDHLFCLRNSLIQRNSKHTGGVAGSDDKQVSGFKEMNQFVQVPENFIGAATLAGNDGTVTDIREGAAGGYNVKVDDKEYYVPNGRNVIVKVGDKVYEGDMLSDGTPNPAELTQYKGIGEGRRYFVEKYRELLKKNGAAVHRRNIEALARGFINRVEVDDPDGYDGYLMGDIVPYDSFAKDYQPRPTSVTMDASQTSGMYLEQPVLHYTVGTRITPHIIKDFKDQKVGNIIVNKSKPVFGAKVVRAKSMLSSDPDWLTRLAGENLKKNLLESARMGGTSTAASTSYFPAMANPTEIDKYLGGDPENRGGQFVNVR